MPIEKNKCIKRTKKKKKKKKNFFKGKKKIGPWGDRTHDLGVISTTL